MDVEFVTPGLHLWMIVTGVTGALALVGSLVGGVLGFKNIWGWLVGSSAFLLPLLVGSLGTMVVLLAVQRALDAMETSAADQILMQEFTRSMYPIGLGLSLTLVCVIVFVLAGVISGVVRKRRQPAAEDAA